MVEIFVANEIADEYMILASDALEGRVSAFAEGDITRVRAYSTGQEDEIIKTLWHKHIVLSQLWIDEDAGVNELGERPRYLHHSVQAEWASEKYGRPYPPMKKRNPMSHQELPFKLRESNLDGTADESGGS